MATLIQSDVTIQYIKPSGLIAVYQGSFYGETNNDCIKAAVDFVTRYLRPSSVTSAALTPKSMA